MTKRGNVQHRIVSSGKSANGSLLTSFNPMDSHANATFTFTDGNVTEPSTHRSSPIEPLDGISQLSSNALIRGHFTSSTTKRPILSLEKSPPGLLIEVSTPPNPHNHPGAEEALLNRSSVLFVAVSFVLLMVISLAWLVFYYVQRFRYLHSKERVSRRLAELAKKAVARIPVKTLHPGDKETLSDTDQCAICIEPYRPLDQLRILPCRHYFHKLCIDPWLLEQRSCPMCKLDILQAYGLRTDFYFNIPGGELSGVPGHVNLLGTVRSGITSASSSDDGMERIALVHSGSLTTCPAPSLAYVVLSTTSADFSTIPVPPTNEGTPEAAGLYFAHNSTPDPRMQSTLVQQHFVGPIPPLTNQVVVPVLPAIAAIQSQMSPESTPGFFMWNREVGNVNSIGDGATVTGTVHPQTCPTANAPIAIISSEHFSSSALSLQHSTCSGVQWSRVPANNAKSKAQEVTSTTQAFTGPVCSVIVEFEGTDIPPMDSCKPSPSLDNKNTQSPTTVPRLATGEPSPPSVDSTGSLHCVSENPGDVKYSDYVFPTLVTGSSTHQPTTSSERPHRHLPTKDYFRRTRSRQKFHLPAVISGINRLSFATWFTPSWLPFRSGRSVCRDGSSVAEPHAFQPDVQASNSPIPSDPLLEHTRRCDFASSSQTPLSFHLPFSTSSQTKRGGTERVVVAVVETPPDPLQNSPSSDSNSGESEHQADDSPRID